MWLLTRSAATKDLVLLDSAGPSIFENGSERASRGRFMVRSKPLASTYDYLASTRSLCQRHSPTPQWLLCTWLMAFVVLGLPTSPIVLVITHKYHASNKNYLVSYPCIGTIKPMLLSSSAAQSSRILIHNSIPRTFAATGCNVSRLRLDMKWCRTTELSLHTR